MCVVKRGPSAPNAKTIITSILLQQTVVGSNDIFETVDTDTHFSDLAQNSLIVCLDISTGCDNSFQHNSRNLYLFDRRIKKLLLLFYSSFIEGVA